MRNKRMRAFLMTLLFYALAGPLVGLLILMVIGFLVEAWGPITDRLLALISHPQSLSCRSPYSGHFDLRCFQRVEPRQFRFPPLDLQTLSLYVFGAYVVGFIPALLAGVLIGAGRLRDFGFGYAVLIGALVGFMLGVGLSTPHQLMCRPEGAISLFFICFIATIVCWLVTRRWWRKANTNLAG